MSEFSEVYKIFIENIGEIADKGISQRESRGEELGILKENLYQLISETSSEYAELAIDFAVMHLNPSVRERLFNEMKFFNSLDDADSRDGDNVKSSLEEILGKWLPDWLMDNLKVLNELLSFGRG
ncbi:hypothetical protein QT231_23825 [Halomonas sp. SpR1]|uniref:hypothetical protein n=1 Tax=Halomonas sp. SpR1 TaxID=3050462 RepID=UPI0027E4DFC5|nr:hypothetical protein [Halomonas sp. SpR1]MDQ7735732.1 hypothetical protein [Halomonas sp. SpR1]